VAEPLTTCATPAMSPDALPSRRERLAELDDAITRAELQIMLLADAVAFRAHEGRTPDGLHDLIDTTDRRLAGMEAERRRLRART
jgi:hypothetical protein